MPDNDQNQEQKPPEQAGDSFSLWEEGKPQEQASAPPAPPQELPPEPSDPRERSQLGRKVAEMERSFSQVSDNINRLTQLMAEREVYQEPYRREESQRYPDRYERREPREEDIYDTPVNTYRDIKEREAMERNITAKHEEAYVSNYVRRVKSMGIGSNADPELHREIEKELLQDGYQKYYRATNHPLKDAEINYNIAKASVLERRYREISNRPNVRGDQQNPPSGMSASGRMPSPPQNVEGLDEYAKKFVGAVGAKDTDEWVQNAVRRKDK